MGQINKSLISEKVRDMSVRDMELLSYEIRDFLLDNVSKTGGHLASNLGAVELTIALHHVFDFPKDKLVWDVGHQAYVHKILTGRAEEFTSLRQTNGLSGFPKRCESEYDVFDSGHSSTSISAAFGMAVARDYKGDNYDVIAVIGDGALTGGTAFEALNNAGAAKNTKSIVVLNDNGMSISPATGSLTKHLSTLRTSSGYLKFKKGLKEHLDSKGSLYKYLENFRDSLKYAIVDGGAIFEELGFTYLGPIDGHNITECIDTLKLAKRTEGPVIVHVITKKGKGYKNAENEPNKFHGVSPFDKETGKPLSKSSSPSYSKVFGDKLASLADVDNRIVAVSAAMIDGTGLDSFVKKYPDRLHDVGIAEGHAVSFAAGLALSGLKPVVAIYSTFLQRAYDQILIDVCMQKLPVVFALDRAGNVGNDGETHHGVFDLSYLSSMPNMTVLAPADGKELEDMLEYALNLDGPCAIRYPRGSADAYNPSPEFDGGSVRLIDGSDCEIWAVGKMLDVALKASEILKNNGINAGVVNVRSVKPLDVNTLSESCSIVKNIITIEDNTVIGGFGSLLNGFIIRNYPDIATDNIGWPDKFIEQGNTEDLFEKYGLTAESVAERISEFIERKN
ncbi:MAG: 1-deoxy-D-xylulose-5-phosphate synthase [Clostridiales bacterium]|nr:1-deoxy-D-xylulose-5-phosphate synthase [Clostridiales bacterium]